MLFRHVEHCRDLALFRTVTNEAGVAAPAEGQREGVQQNGLPAPVSPVRTARPFRKSISSRSIRTMSRIESRASMRS
jgi:hypothetical protein